MIQQRLHCDQHHLRGVIVLQSFFVQNDSRGAHAELNHVNCRVVPLRKSEPCVAIGCRNKPGPVVTPENSNLMLRSNTAHSHMSSRAGGGWKVYRLIGGRWISCSDFCARADGVGTWRPRMPVSAAPAAEELEEGGEVPVIGSSSPAPGLF